MQLLGSLLFFVHLERQWTGGASYHDVTTSGKQLGRPDWGLCDTGCVFLHQGEASQGFATSLKNDLSLVQGLSGAAAGLAACGRVVAVCSEDAQ